MCATMHSVTDGQTDRRTYDIDAKSRSDCVQYDRLYDVSVGESEIVFP